MLLKELNEMAMEYRQFDELAQAVWAAQSVEEKKELLREMVGQFKFKEKQAKFMRKIEMENRPQRLDKLAADLMQVGHGNAVV